MDVIMVHEDNHGILGVAINYTSAIDMLVENKWLDTFWLKCILEIMSIKH